MAKTDNVRYQGHSETGCKAPLNTPYTCIFPGRVVINNSVRGMFTLPGTPAYNASKHALDTYADSLRLEMQKFSVKVALVEPGKFGTATAIVCPEQVNQTIKLEDSGTLEMRLVCITSCWYTRY